jgi:hypothetical protein
MLNKTFDRSTQDVGNIIALEHVNVTVPDHEVAALFYVTLLGFTRDPYMDFGTRNMWVNIGSQQIHMPRSNAQVLRGRIGVVVPDLAQFQTRLTRLEQQYADRLQGTCYRSQVTPDGSRVDMLCPWGNRLQIHGASEAFGGLTLGIPYVEIDVAPGGAAGIARFYREVMGAPAHTAQDSSGDRAVVRIGRAQELIFRETTNPLPDYDGHHIAVYLGNFSKPYQALLERGLVSRETNDHEYRIQNVIDLDSGKVLATVEHEVRSMFHPMFDRELVNRNTAQSMRGYQSGHDAFVGVAHGGRG